MPFLVNTALHHRKAILIVTTYTYLQFEVRKMVLGLTPEQIQFGIMTAQSLAALGTFCAVIIALRRARPRPAFNVSVSYGIISGDLSHNIKHGDECIQFSAVNCGMYAERITLCGYSFLFSSKDVFIMVNGLDIIRPANHFPCIVEPGEDFIFLMRLDDFNRKQLDAFRISDKIPLHFRKRAIKIFLYFTYFYIYIPRYAKPIKQRLSPFMRGYIYEQISKSYCKPA